jgi:hypothetical protein
MRVKRPSEALRTPSCRSLSYLLLHCSRSPRDAAGPCFSPSCSCPCPLRRSPPSPPYHSAVTADGTTLHYTREYTVKQLQLDASRYDNLRKFSERVAYDEASSAVLKKK